ELFLAEQRRAVRKDRTVTLDGVAYEVDAALVGERVLLRFDASRDPGKRRVEVWHQGKHVETARRVDALANCFVKRNDITKTIEVEDPTEADRISMPEVQQQEIPHGNSMRDLQNLDDDEGLF